MEKKNNITDKELDEKVEELLSSFYSKRIAGLEKAKAEIASRIKNKNPYLFCALGISSPEDFISALLDAHISSSDETLFGNDFFEPLAKWSASKAWKDPEGNCTVQTSLETGVDISIETLTKDYCIAVKSGVKIFNAQSKKQQATNFLSINKRKQKDKRAFEAIVGYCYGKKQSRNTQYNFSEYAGEDFWEFLTGDSSFYLRIATSIAKHSTKNNQTFCKIKASTTEQLIDYFKKTYVEDGAIKWEALVKEVCSTSRESESASTQQKKEKECKPKKKKKVSQSQPEELPSSREDTANPTLSLPSAEHNRY